MKIFSVDPGNTQSGVVKYDQKIISASIMSNEQVLETLKHGISDDYVVLIEDIKPYSVRMSQQTVDTIKFIGVLEHELIRSKLTFMEIYRWQVKKWVFDTFDEAKRRVVEKMDRKKVVNKDGTPKKPSFVYVDDRIVLACMKELWNIPTPKPGRKSLYGLSKHSWQALALISFYIAGAVLSGPET